VKEGKTSQQSWIGEIKLKLCLIFPKPELKMKQNCCKPLV